MSDEDGEPQLPLDDQPEGFDAGDPAQVRRRETTQQIKDRESARFWQDVFNSEIGRREMWRLIDAGKPFETPFACGPNGFPQPEATWFKAGAADYSLRIYQTWLHRFPLLTMAMHSENDPRFMPAPKKPRKRSE